MILSRQELSEQCERLRLLNKKIVFTNGCFDILHAGHISYLQAASKLGDVLVVGLNTDSSVKKLKGNSRPINSETDRAMILDALRCVDFVTLFDEETPLQLIQNVLPNILVKGGDYTEDTVVGANIVKSYGGKITLLPFIQGRSTTEIIKKILEL